MLEIKISIDMLLCAMACDGMSVVLVQPSALHVRDSAGTVIVTSRSKP